MVVVRVRGAIGGGTARTTPEALEMRGVRARAIPWGEIAFKTSFFAIRDWVRLRAPATAVPRDFTEP